MAATPLCEAPLAALKKSLRDEFPDAKSSHLSEALAASLGFRTYASLQAAMTGPEEDRPFVLLNSEMLRKRLMQFGYPDDPEFEFELMNGVPGNGVVSTWCNHAWEIEYKTERQRAWRNLMICAVNAALDRRIFTLRPGDNRFEDEYRRGVPIDFTLPNGLPARASVADAGFDEVAVHAAVNPKGRHVDAMAGFDCGDAVAMTWLERRRGAWMQTSDTQFHCRRSLLSGLAALDVTPAGYGDRGRVIM
ncbi:hypothetical protein HHL11_10090 [Ramlibacter sp. G-1-2-2]|uniref:Uncharacterized protein n=1 Tax=Ramlibacter agri TaxID=2728837 RepID=A0A848H3K7_9BURK|nr:hypothetical protein [Ramlibacter agri]NML44099.1 hypothetical protein [Ramlibacter agri]